MDENIKRVEKLVHATNSALAQMKFSLMFDDINGGKKERTLRPEGPDRMLVDKFLNEDELKQCQKEFQLEANKMRTKVEMFSSNESNRKNSKAIDRIKEINKEISNIRLERSKPEETEQSRQKLFSLINEEKLSSDIISSKRFIDSKPTISFNRQKDSVEKIHPAHRENGSLFNITKFPNNSKVELKNKILETQEIVDRGFLTAKQLAQKVEWMTKWDRKEKTPGKDKTVNEKNSTNLEKKTESNKTIKIVKCKRHSEKEKNRGRIVQEVEQVNTQVIDVKRKELQRRVKSNLQLQRLPSVHIREGLKLQKIHNLEIPANEDITCQKLNTAISFLSHEQMERKKMEKIVEKVKRENYYCIENSIHRNYVECFNCGKLNKIRDIGVDPRKIDEILYQCNFNIFDPRIDEFAEKFGTVGFKNWCEKTQSSEAYQSDVFIPDEPNVKPKDTEEKIETKDQNEQFKKSRGFTLREFSDQIFKKYKQEVETLEDNHLKLDNIVQNLFSKVDESRKVFEDCHFLKNVNSKKIPNLTPTKPILVTLTGSSFKSRKRRKKLSRKAINKTKSGTESPGIKTRGKKVLYTASSPTQLEEAKSIQEEILSFIQLNQNGSVKSGATELQERSSLTRHTKNTENLERKEEVEDKLSSVTSTSENKNRNPHQPEMFIKKKYTEKPLTMASIQRKTAKLLDGVCREEEMLNRSLVTEFSSKSNTIKLSNTKKEKLEEDKILTVATSISSDENIDSCQENLSLVQSKTVKGVFKKKDVEIESLITLSKNKINSDTVETASEKSENIYESDFESFTNELEGKENEYEEEEKEKPELFPCVKKLSIISEVDSELEKKLGDEQKGTKNTYFEMDDSRKAFETSVSNIMRQEKNLDLLKLKEGDSVISEISSKNKKAFEVSLKSSPSELVTSLKDVLSALQDQFAETESLAEKLTDNVQMKRKEKEEPDLAPMMLGAWKMATPDKVVENLQSARKNWTFTPKLSLSLIVPEKIESQGSEKSEKDLFADSLSDEGGSSLGEIIVSDRRRINSGKSENSSLSESNFLYLNSAKRSTNISSGRKVPGTPSGLNLLS